MMLFLNAGNLSPARRAKARFTNSGFVAAFSTARLVRVASWVDTCFAASMLSFDLSFIFFSQWHNNPDIGFSYCFADRPPSTVRTVPVTHFESSEHRYATAPDMSSGSPITRKGKVDSRTFL